MKSINNNKCRVLKIIIKVIKKYNIIRRFLFNNKNKKVIIINMDND